MNFQRFTLPDGTTDCFVNLDQIIAAKPNDNGTVNLHTAFMTVTVDAKQFEDALAKADSSKDAMPGLLSRLIQALDRLSVRIPSSIRLHI